MKKFSLLVFSVFVFSSMVVFQSANAYQMRPVEPSEGHSHMGAKQDNPPLTGKIIETMNGGGYTYVCIENEGKKTWVAMPEMTVTVGQDITLQPGHEMVNFTSKSLDRTFESIIFSAGPVSSHGGGHGGGYTSKGSKGVKVPADEKIQVQKPSGPNAFTVAELHEKRAELNKETVVLRGKVVKVSPRIMGKNWLHIQDGTGNQQDGTFDLVVTTQDLPKVGDIVTIEGILYKDKDFGSGYRYNVIIEQAQVK